MLNKSCIKYLEELSSSSAVPGGGGAAAFCSAQGIALGEMVGNLTLGKKKYADVQEDVMRVLQEFGALREELILLVQKDADVFEPLSIAYGLPSSTELERSKKDEIMQECLKNACAVPMQIMGKSMEALIFMEEMGRIGTKIALSDVAVGAEFLKASIYSGAMNVYINTKSMKDRAYAMECEQKADAIKKDAEKKAKEIYRAIEEELRCQK